MSCDVTFNGNFVIWDYDGSNEGLNTKKFCKLAIHRWREPLLTVFANFCNKSTHSMQFQTTNN